MKKKVFALILAVLLALSLAAPALAVSIADTMKAGFHNAANIYRDIGCAENSAFIMINKRGWDMADGKDVSGCYFYDATTGTKYYLANANVVKDEDYYDGQYQWYWSTSAKKYYRWDKNGNRVWGSGSRTLNYDYNSNSERTANLSNYNYTYNNVKLYAGRISNVTSSATKADAEYLARFILSLAAGKDLKTKAAAGWMILNAKGNLSFSNLVPYIPSYNANLSLTTEEGKDAVNLAYELFFRKNAEAAGNSYVGRILPSNYSYYWIDENGNLFFRASSNGTFYDFPDYNSSGKSYLHSPY